MPSPAFPRLAIDTQPERSHVSVLLGGELDMASVDEVERAMRDLRGSGWDDIRLDVRDVSFVDSCGLSMLIQLADDAARERWRFAIRGQCPPLERLLEVTCLTARFERA